MQDILIPSHEDTLAATIFDSKDADAILIIASATGVKQSYYRDFAQFMCARGMTVVTFDYLGIGKSLHGPIKKLTHSAADWGTKDLESVLAYALEHYPEHKKYLLGHSIGGQLIGLAKSAVNMNKIILVAAQSGYWKYWPGFSKVRMWANWYLLFPPLLLLFGYLPSKKISGMENLPRNVAKQWSGWGRKKDYLLSEISLEETVYHQIKAALTSFSIDDDDFAPKEAVEWMVANYANAKKKSIHLMPSTYEVSKIGHFGIFKKGFEGSIWQDLLKELKE